MAESTQADHGALVASFEGHLTAFHQSLPAEERTLFAQVWALASSASLAEGDVQGFDASSPSLLTVMFDSGPNGVRGPAVCLPVCRPE
jgi:hypothetical protein